MRAKSVLLVAAFALCAVSFPDMGHARALLPLTSAQQVAVAQRIVQKALSVREAEHLVQQIMNPQKAAAPIPIDRDLLRLQEELSDSVGATVAIRSNRKGSGKTPSNSAVSTSSTGY